MAETPQQDTSEQSSFSFSNSTLDGQASALTQRLARRLTHPVGVVNTRPLQRQLMRMPEWIVQRTALLEQVATRYSSGPGGERADLILVAPGQRVVHNSPSAGFLSESRGESLQRTVDSSWGSSGGSEIQRSPLSPKESGSVIQRTGEEALPIRIGGKTDGAGVTTNLTVSNIQRQVLTEDSSDQSGNLSVAVGREVQQNISTSVNSGSSMSVSSVQQPLVQRVMMALPRLIQRFVASRQPSDPSNRDLVSSSSMASAETSERSPILPVNSSYSIQTVPEQLPLPLAHPPVHETAPSPTSHSSLMSDSPPIDTRLSAVSTVEATQQHSTPPLPLISKLPSSPSLVSPSPSFNLQRQRQQDYSSETTSRESVLLPGSVQSAVPQPQAPTNTETVVPKLHRSESSASPSLTLLQPKIQLSNLSGIQNLSSPSPISTSSATLPISAGSVAIARQSSAAISPPIHQNTSTGTTLLPRAPELPNYPIVNRSMIWRKETASAGSGNGSDRPISPLASSLTPFRSPDELQRQTTTTTPETSPTSSPTPLPTPSPTPPSAPSMNINQIADQVSRILSRRFVVERERRGIKQW